MFFAFFSVGVQTIVLMAGIFGSDELGLPTANLILTILLVQIVAIVGAFIFSRLSNKYGNLTALKITLIIWGLVCFLAFSLDKSQENVDIYFYILGGVLGLVLGATQSLARSTYSKLLPETEDHATYFSFYDVTEKIAIVLGTFVYGLLYAMTDSMQWSVLCLAIFFLASAILFSMWALKLSFSSNRVPRYLTTRLGLMNPLCILNPFASSDLFLEKNTA